MQISPPQHQKDPTLTFWICYLTPGEDDSHSLSWLLQCLTNKTTQHASDITRWTRIPQPQPQSHFWSVKNDVTCHCSYCFTGLWQLASTGSKLWKFQLTGTFLLEHSKEQLHTANPHWWNKLPNSARSQVSLPLSRKQLDTTPDTARLYYTLGIIHPPCSTFTFTNTSGTFLH